MGAFTLAPFDDAGGHVNGATGYHYHATTGKSTKIKQADGHAAMIGYAMDGYGLFENLDESNKESTDLDASRGHYDATRGYHYHVAPTGTKVEPVALTQAQLKTFQASQVSAKN